MLHDMLAYRGLATTSVVVVSGCSAGGLSMYKHNDHIASSMPRARTVGLPHSCFFPDIEMPKADPITQVGYLHEGHKWAYHAMNASSGVHQVTALLPLRQKNVIDAYYPSTCWRRTYPDTKMFALHGIYDSWTMLKYHGSAALIIHSGGNKGLWQTLHCSDLKAIAKSDAQWRVVGILPPSLRRVDIVHHA